LYSLRELRIRARRLIRSANDTEMDTDIDAELNKACCDIARAIKPASLRQTLMFLWGDSEATTVRTYEDRIIPNNILWVDSLRVAAKYDGTNYDANYQTKPLRYLDDDAWREKYPYDMESIDRLKGGNITHTNPPDDASPPANWRIREIRSMMEIDATEHTTFKIASDNALDIAGTVAIIGVVNAAPFDTIYNMTGTLNGSDGTTEVTVTPPEDVCLRAVSKDRATTGSILVMDSVSSVLATLLPWQRSAQVHVLQARPVPDANHYMAMEVGERPIMMVNDADFPHFLPEDMADLPVKIALPELMKLAFDDDRWMKHKAAADDELGKAASRLRRNSKQPAPGWRWPR
jgi:hypothetical protein